LTSQVLSTQVSPIDAWVRLLRGYAATKRLLSAQLFEEHDLTINDYEALLLLSQAEGNSMRRIDLSQKLLLTPSGVTRLLDGLQASGLVEKSICSRDARVTYAVLTERGKKRFDQASKSHIAAISEFFEARFSEVELQSLVELLSRLPEGGAPLDHACSKAAKEFSAEE
jgi:DNA-binding MarR family transcriptional regulator